MRKFLTVLASGALVVSMSAPAFAADARHSSKDQPKTERGYRFGDCQTWGRHHRDGMHRPSHCRPGR
ncbi:MAG: hypothetical protein QOI86_4758 [Actinomycetota bacterium]|jgi:hypothetical protein|nr:hypothetical protein [Actinomycetota bacterium]